MDITQQLLQRLPLSWKVPAARCVVSLGTHVQSKFALQTLMPYGTYAPSSHVTPFPHLIHRRHLLRGSHSRGPINGESGSDTSGTYMVVDFVPTRIVLHPVMSHCNSNVNSGFGSEPQPDFRRWSPSRGAAVHVQR
jgi:hypothetical protein